MPATVVIAEELSAATSAALGPDAEVVRCDGRDRDALRAALADADALLVRSATRVDAEALSWAPRLRVVARAGVGLDNVDVDAASAAGVLVVNAPTSTVVSAAELAVGLLLAAVRQIPQAHRSLVGGRWERSRFLGTELAGRTVGVLGLGRIGAAVATRLAAFDMRVVGYDPYIAPVRATQIGVERLDLDTLLERADVLTVHLPKTPETTGLIDARALARLRPGAVVVNAARGGIVDEQALAAALADGQVAAAALDVFAEEPCTESPLFAMPQVVVTPHLGASTRDAQEKAGVSVARSVRVALAGGLVPEAVNVPGGPVDDELRDAVPLAERLGRLLTAVERRLPRRLEVRTWGAWSDAGLDPVALASSKGVLAGLADEGLSYVNVASRVAEAGIEVDASGSTESSERRTMMCLTAVYDDGGRRHVAGAPGRGEGSRRLVQIDDHELDVPLQGHLLFLDYADRPGVVGEIGRVLGVHHVNISGMQVSRARERAVAVLTLDGALPDGLAERIRATIAADAVAGVDLSD